jgi:hypothetical protein
MKRNILISVILTTLISLNINSAQAINFSKIELKNISLPLAVKDDYLDYVCDANYADDLFFDSYFRYSDSYFTQVNYAQNWSQFWNDGQNVMNNNKSWAKWMKAKKKNFPKGAQKNVTKMVNQLNYQNDIIVALFNSTTFDNIGVEWSNYRRANIVTGNLSGKLRKSLKLPTREGNAGCP